LGVLLFVGELTLDLVCCHCIIEHIQLSRKREIVKVGVGILMTFDMVQPKAKRHMMRGL
jgi:hypothetical protein